MADSRKPLVVVQKSFSIGALKRSWTKGSKGRASKKSASSESIAQYDEQLGQQSCCFRKRLVDKRGKGSAYNRPTQTSDVSIDWDPDRPSRNAYIGENSYQSEASTAYYARARIEAEVTF